MTRDTFLPDLPAKSSRSLIGSPRRRTLLSAAGIFVLSATAGTGLYLSHPSRAAASSRVDISAATTVAPLPATRDLHGRIEVAQGATDQFLDAAIGQPCDSSGGGFADITTGGQVTVTDAQATIVADGTIDHGVYAGDSGISAAGIGGSGDVPLGCTFTFSADAVPTGAKYFTVHVGNRGVTYSSQELTADNWDINITLGGGDGDTGPTVQPSDSASSPSPSSDT